MSYPVVRFTVSFRASLRPIQVSERDTGKKTQEIRKNTRLAHSFVLCVLRFYVMPKWKRSDYTIAKISLYICEQKRTNERKNAGFDHSKAHTDANTRDATKFIMYVWEAHTHTTHEIALFQLLIHKKFLLAILRRQFIAVSHFSLSLGIFSLLFFRLAVSQRFHVNPVWNQYHTELINMSKKTKI